MPFFRQRVPCTRWTCFVFWRQLRTFLLWAGELFFKQPQKLSHISTLVYTDDDEEEEQTTSELLAEKLENFKSANVALTDNQNVDCLLALHVTLNGLNVHVLAKIYRLSRRRTLGSGTPGRPISRYSGGLDSSTACYGGRGE